MLFYLQFKSSDDLTENPLVKGLILVLIAEYEILLTPVFVLANVAVSKLSDFAK